MTAMTCADFEALYRADPDPWGYRSSSYERLKYAATLAACGEGPFADALELGASIGVFSALLAPRCRRLRTIDFSPTAVDIATDALAPYPGATALLGTIPGSIPDGPFDLVVASEILYYLDPLSLEGTLDRLRQTIAPGGRLVPVHWRPTGPDRPTDAASVHALLRGLPWLEIERGESTDEYLLDVMRRR